LKKLKIYLDTSVISHLDVTNRLDWMAETRKLWDEITAGKYDVYLSETTLTEISRCEPQKFNFLMDILDEIEYTVLPPNEEIDEVAEMVVSMGILKKKSLDDSFHIGSAVVGGCDVIVSWNFKHLVNIKTIKGVRAITTLQGYPNIEIVSPSMLIEREE